MRTPLFSSAALKTRRPGLVFDDSRMQDYLHAHPMNYGVESSADHDFRGIKIQKTNNVNVMAS